MGALRGGEAGQEGFGGYLLEQSLSVDKQGLVSGGRPGTRGGAGGEHSTG